ncbi:hypothetical protein [Actinoplanes sp. HUAS TT8]|uniref:hypothetical protein n=1 Tax=Actinoplanes sp. HUAS TT8 TaxID=3447453 RepID=UPI003F524DD1
MTIYAVHDGALGGILAVWPTGDAHRAAVLGSAFIGAGPSETVMLAEALSELSRSLWQVYAEPAQLDDEQMGGGSEAMFAAVAEAITAPNLPNGDGSVLMSYDEPVECAHEVGRVLHAIGDSAISEVVVVEVGSEVDAIQRAGRGDFAGRAAQGVVAEVVDPPPSQVATADQLFRASPLGDPRLFHDVTPAAACVAGAHWLVAAAGVAAECAGVAAGAVFADADDIEAVSVEVPTYVVRQSLAGLGPREIVTQMLSEAANARDGLTPDPLRLPALVDAARAEALSLPVGKRGDALMMLLQRLTPLDPGRASRDLLEHLLDGIRSCLMVYDEAIGDVGVEADEDPTSAAGQRSTHAFLAAVRERAHLLSVQLLR